MDAAGNLLLMDGTRYRLKLLGPRAADYLAVRPTRLDQLKFWSDAVGEGWFLNSILLNSLLHESQGTPGNLLAKAGFSQHDQPKLLALAKELEKPLIAKNQRAVAGVAWFERLANTQALGSSANEPDGPYLLSVFEGRGKEAYGMTTVGSGTYSIRIAGRRQSIQWDAQQPGVLLVAGVPHEIKAESVTPDVLCRWRLLRVCKLDTRETEYTTRDVRPMHGWQLDGRVKLGWNIAMNRWFGGNAYYKQRLEKTLSKLGTIIKERMNQDEKLADDQKFRNRVAWVAFATEHFERAGVGKTDGIYYRPIFLSKFKPMEPDPEIARTEKKKELAVILGERDGPRN